MKNYRLLYGLAALLFSSSIFGQDLVVQSFNYDSETRDTVVSFPTDDHNKWEKIIMLYSMRCKDGLVSTPAQRNLGCGEWDYSCNTYITDSTQVDSLYRVSPDFEISNFSGTDFSYSETPTYTYYQSDFKEVNVLDAQNEMVYSIDDAETTSDLMSGMADDQKRMQFEWTRAKLVDAGLTEGPIDALTLSVAGG